MIRRSRLQVRPNLGSGPKVSGLRSGPKVDSAKSNQDKKTTGSTDTKKDDPLMNKQNENLSDTSKNLKSPTTTKPSTKQSTPESENKEKDNVSKNVRVRGRFPKAKPNLVGSGRAPKRKATPSPPPCPVTPEPEEPPPVSTCVPPFKSKTPPETTCIVDETRPTPPGSPTPSIGSMVSQNSQASGDLGDDPINMDISEKKSSDARKESRRVRPRVTFDVDKPPDKTKMTMRDLIYWNPKNNPMKKKETKINAAPQRKSLDQENEPEVREEESRSETPVSLEDDGDSLPVPQIKIGPDGNIVLNEESVIIPPSQPVVEHDDEIINEDDHNISYGSFKKRTNTKKWTEKETKKFFKALSHVGTDFTLMKMMFPKRSRAELKNKFKKEERHNKLGIDKAIGDRQHFDQSLFDQESSEDETPKKTNKRSRAKNVKGKKRKKGKKSLDDHGEIDDEGCLSDGSIASTVISKDHNGSGNDDDDDDAVSVASSQSSYTGDMALPSSTELRRSTRPRQPNLLYTNVRDIAQQVRRRSESISSTVDIDLQPPVRVLSPPGSRVLSPPGSRVLSPPGSRVLSPPGSRVLSPGTRVLSTPGSRVMTPGTRVLSPPGSRVMSPGIRVLSPPGSRVMSPGPVAVPNPQNPGPVSAVTLPELNLDQMAPGQVVLLTLRQPGIPGQDDMVHVYMMSPSHTSQSPSPSQQAVRVQNVIPGEQRTNIPIGLRSPLQGTDVQTLSTNTHQLSASVRSPPLPTRVTTPVTPSSQTYTSLQSALLTEPLAETVTTNISKECQDSQQ